MPATRPSFTGSETGSRARIDRALHRLRAGLGPFVERQIGVARLNQDERLADFRPSSPRLREKRFREWDASGLLGLMQYMWQDVFRHALGRAERDLVSELKDWRNKWAHQERFSADDEDRTLKSIVHLLRAVRAEAQAAEVARLRERPLPVAPSPPPAPPQKPPQFQTVPGPPTRQPESPSQADAIRRYAIARHVEPWRQSGADEPLAIRAGDIVREMGLRQATPNVCSALEGRKFLDQARLVLVHRDGPRRSTTTTFHYRRG